MKTATAKKFTRLLAKVTTQINATRLWNWIDSQRNPEPLWAEMAANLPWAFDDQRDPGTIRFSYAE